MKKLIFLFFIIFNSLCAYSQNKKAEIDQQIEQIMKARDEMIKSLLNDSAFQNFDKHFEDLMKNFEKSSFDSSAAMGGAVIGEYDWRETDTHQIFVLKVKQIKDRPLDIKIEKGIILLKGDVESVDEDTANKIKRVSKVHFERTFSIPDGVDQTNPEFENKEGELKILFKKITLNNSSKNKKLLPLKPKTVVPIPDADQKSPIGMDPNDITI